MISSHIFIVSALLCWSFAPGDPGDNLAPICDAGPMQFLEADGPISHAQLDGTNSFDPDGDTLTYFWECTDDGVTFDDPTSATPVMMVDMLGFCLRECSEIFLTVSDGQDISQCDTVVVLEDTTAPAMLGPLNRVDLFTTGYPGQCDPLVTGMATMTDLVDPAPVMTFVDVVTAGMPPTGIEFIVDRTWTATDYCGNQVNWQQQIMVVGQSFYDHPMFALMPLHCPNDFRMDRPAWFIATLKGREGFSPTDINLRTLRLQRQDGVGVPVSPIAARVRDAFAPQPGTHCTTLAGDGYADLVLRFDIMATADLLELFLVPDGATLEVMLVGQTYDGRFVGGMDEINVINPDS